MFAVEVIFLNACQTNCCWKSGNPLCQYDQYCLWPDVPSRPSRVAVWATVERLKSTITWSFCGASDDIGCSHRSPLAVWLKLRRNLLRVWFTVLSSQSVILLISCGFYLFPLSFNFFFHKYWKYKVQSGAKKIYTHQLQLFFIKHQKTTIVRA